MKPALVTILLALLAVPAAASATTYTVGPSQQYPTIGAALAKATDGDTIHVVPGVYAEQPLTVARAVRIEGEAGTVVTNDASADPTKPLFTVTSNGASLATLTVADTAGTAIAGQGADLAISDALILSTSGPGPAVRLTGSGTTSIARASIAAIDPAADAVQVAPSGTAALTLALDSSILSGGTKAASLRVTRANSLPTGIASVTVTAVHATIAGAATAIAADSSGMFPLAPAGSIAVSADRSIIRGSQTSADCAKCLNPNTAAITVTKSDTSTADVFVNAAAKNFHLRADAGAVIDQAGPALSGESDRDIDGQPRVAGAASDLGADEFVNQAPTARLAAPAAVRTPGATSFDASASTDPEAGAGGGVASYHFDFGDGTSADSATPVVSHAYARPGTYTATVTVSDAQGLASAASSPVQAQVVDGIAPSVRVISPRNARKLRRRAIVRITGSAGDDTAVAAVGLTLRRPGSARAAKIVVRVQQGIWSYRLPGRLKRKRGRYTVTAYAVDQAGNLSSPARVRFTLE